MVIESVPLLAHIGSPNNPWIGMLTVSSWILILVYGLVAAARVRVESAGDLLLPLAGATLAAGLFGGLGDVITDQGPWAAPAGVVALSALLLEANTEVQLRWSGWGGWAVVGVAVVSAAALYGPLDSVWFPTDVTGEPLPATRDASVVAEVVRASIAERSLEVRVAVEGATLGSEITATRPEDPQNGLVPTFEVDGVDLGPANPLACASVQPCTEATFELDLPESLARSELESIVVEMLTADGRSFAPALKAETAVSP